MLEDLVPVVLSDEAADLPPLAGHLTEAARAELEGLAPWGYGFPVAPGVSSKDFDRGPDDADAAESELTLRMGVLERALLELELDGAERRDIATNCGIIPILLAKRAAVGVARVTAIDLQQVNVDKARALARLAGAGELEFFRADAFEYLRGCRAQSVDVVTALGLFYHLSNPLELIAELRRVARRAVIIDTIVHNFPFSGWVQTVTRFSADDELTHAYDPRKVAELHPTHRGMVDSLYQHGFREVREHRPSAGLLARRPAPIYATLNRRFYVATT